jgi:hypothetical protein
MFPPPANESILSAGNSSMDIDGMAVGEGRAMRVVGRGTICVVGMVGMMEAGMTWATEGLSEYGSSSSAIMRVGGVDAMPVIRDIPLYSSLDTHSDVALTHTYLN